ncbi:DoxX family protein [Campylobacter blaseri]|uniref:HvfX family Cu-binding RiPP maturation protein n=1 Tax=Campylobacter blaseri TaxID=2042961 RepID=UPI00267F5A10|nr:DoxX family protein [Campylobacter blaseri]
MTQILNKVNNCLNNLQSVGLFFARMLLAYGFYEPAINKFSDIQGISTWFASLGIPFPLLNAYAATYTEIFGVILLVLGLFTRYISFLLIMVLTVAIMTVHFANGFSVGNNGFEIPLYYISFLIILMGFGAGKISLDHIIKRKFYENTAS